MEIHKLLRDVSFSELFAGKSNPSIPELCMSESVIKRTSSSGQKQKPTRRFQKRTDR